MSVVCYRVRAMKRSLRDISEAVGARLQGDENLQLGGVASIDSASESDLVFVEEEKYLPSALKSKAGAVIAGEFAANSRGKPLLISTHPKLSFAWAARFLQGADRSERETGVHTTAMVNRSARIAPGVLVGER